MNQQQRALAPAFCGPAHGGTLAPLVTTATTTVAAASTPFKVCMGTGGTPGTPWQTGQGTVMQSIAKKEGGPPSYSATSIPRQYLSAMLRSSSWTSAMSWSKARSRSQRTR